MSQKKIKEIITLPSSSSSSSSNVEYSNFDDIMVVDYNANPEVITIDESNNILSIKTAEKPIEPVEVKPSITDTLSQLYSRDQTIDLSDFDDSSMQVDKPADRFKTRLPMRPSLSLLDKPGIIAKPSILKDNKRVLPFGFIKSPKKLPGTEEKALDSLKKWTSSIAPIEKLPEKRLPEASSEDVPKKKPKDKLNKVYSKEQSSMYTIEEIYKKFSDTNKADAKPEKPESTFNAAEERNRREKAYRENALKTFTPTAIQIDPEQLKVNQKANRKMNKDGLAEFFSSILTIDLFSPLENSRLPKIPTVFTEPEAYISSFMPAFFEEAAAELLSALGQNDMSEFSIVSITVQREIDDFGYISFNQIDGGGFKFAQRAQPDDLIIIVPYDKADDRKFTKSFKDWEKIDDYCLGFVEKSQKGRFFEVKVDKRFLIRLFRDTDDASKSQWRVFIVDSCTTMLREFKMIKNAEFLSLSEFIFNPGRQQLALKPENIDEFVSGITRLFNESQLSTIRKAASIALGVVLIQGPPGTGKTHTITGILSALLHKFNSQCKILVCAPSNSAVDELASRIINEKLLGLNGAARNDIKLLRLGTQHKSAFDLRENLNKGPHFDAIQSITLSNLVKTSLVDPMYKILYTKIDNIENLLTAERKKKKKDSEAIKKLENKKSRVRMQIFTQKSEYISAIQRRKEEEVKVINSAHIIFTTLSGAACKDLGLFKHNFDYVIVDEACQCIELSSLIPFQYDSKVVIMVGDPMQLPATTFSAASRRNLYARSLFERMQEAGCQVSMLNEQYRMAKEICDFPSVHFYQGRLNTFCGLSSRAMPGWIQETGVIFIDLKTSLEIKLAQETSIYNMTEADFIISLYKELEPLHASKLRIGIITPYKKQVSVIKQLLYDANKDWRLDIEVNTVDGFQGREKDVIIFSAVRSGDSIGFLADPRRMNVALTRAKFALWIIGNSQCLQKNEDWKQLINYLKSKNKKLECSKFEQVRGALLKCEKRKSEVKPIVSVEVSQSAEENKTLAESINERIRSVKSAMVKKEVDMSQDLQRIPLKQSRDLVRPQKIKTDSSRSSLDSTKKPPTKFSAKPSVAKPVGTPKKSGTSFDLISTIINRK